MRSANRIYLVLMVGALAAACGKGTPGGPTSPSVSTAASVSAVAPAVSAPAVGGATISGVVRGAVSAARVLSTASATSVKVSVVGTSISTTTDASGQFTLSGVPPGSVTLAFESNGVNAAVNLTVAEGQKINITVTVNGSTASLNAEPAPPASSSTVEVEGTISGLAGTCPTLVTFTLNGKAIKTDATTVFDGTPCASIVNGDKADVTGTVQGDSSVLASKVEVEKPETPPPPKVPDTTTELEGVISGLKGVCPTVSFVINGKTITTTSATTFDESPCSNLANGKDADVQGTVQPDNSILASKVEVGGSDDGGGDDGNKGGGTKVEGSISGLKGACPAVSFVVNGKTVTTTSATKFDETSCSKITNGMSAEVKGTVQADKSILASEVDAEKSDGKDGDDDNNND